MKKFITLVAVVALAVSTAIAQQVNVNAFNAKVEKSNVDIANPKKAGKAATWISRGKIYIDAILAPTKSLFSGLPVDMLTVNLGTTPSEVNGDVHVFEWVDVHTKGGKVVAWKVKKQVFDNAYEAAKEALLKAYELDNGQIDRIKELFISLIKHYEELGNVSIEVTEYAVAIDAYIKAASIQETPIFGKADARYYNAAGIVATVLGSQDIKYYAMGEKFLGKAIELGYSDEQGSIYYYLFHCYYGQREANKDNLIKAKNTLLDGIAKYPRNQRIMEGLVQLYTAEDGVGDPAELVSHLDKMLAETPDNAELWYARGQLFYNLKNYNECIKSFEKINELKPNDFLTNYYLGYFYFCLGNEAQTAFNNREEYITSASEKVAAKNEVNEIFKKALPWFEKALELKPDDIETASQLKQTYYRLRDEDGMKEKYDKYDALYKKLKGIQ